MPNIGPVQLIIILLIVLLVFGTKRIRTLGSDLGGAIKEFRKGVGDGDGDESPNSAGSDHDASKSSSKND